MAKINVATLTKQIRDAAKGELTDKWPEIKDYANTEAKKIAETIKMISIMTAAGKMSQKAAKIHLRIQKNAATTVLLTVEGLGLIAVENAINAAVRVIQDTVNKAVGFRLI
ncbi:MAG: hypothetical protein OER80_12285 [Gammaproteobacteria bacterium]|nr:hypothetical protein [Gammaproteobacteria bacterium]MDH3769071.1 hypothetical protein [Gammaproteobacteria bacterium]